MDLSLNALRAQYEQLFNTCVVDPAHLADINHVVDRIMPGQPRYQAVGGPLGIPWYFIGLVHNMECSLSFNRHLHNGDPLSQRTIHVPANRPPVWNPPSDWESSATDALQHQGFAHLADWGLGAVIYRLEGYNGYGYHVVNPPINSPYLWSFSNHYTKGKYVADHVFDPNAVSSQCGSAVILFQMVQRGIVQFAPAAGGQ